MKTGKANGNAKAGKRSPYGSSQTHNNLAKKPVKKGAKPKNR